ncbi:MAG: cache domain-containing sensor histidine kinase [bacterium]
MIAILPMLFLGIVAFYYTRSVFDAQTRERTRESVGLIANAVDLALDQHLVQVNTLATDLGFLADLRTFQQRDTRAGEDAYGRLYSALVGLVVTSDVIVTAELQDRDGLVAYAKYRSSRGTFARREGGPDAPGRQTRVIWELWDHDELFGRVVQGAGSRVIVLAVSLRDPGDGGHIGRLVLGLNSDGLVPILADSVQARTGEVFLLDPTGRTAVYYGSRRKSAPLGPDLSADTVRAILGPGSPGESSERVRFDGAESAHYLSVATSDLTGWSVMYAVSAVEALRATRAIGWLIVVGILLSVVVVVPSSLAVTRGITDPIARIVAAMDSMERQNFQHRLRDESPDELGTLAHAFDRMNDRIRSLITEVYEGRIHQKEAELRALQAQINPHFLYNTLDSINWMAYRSGQNEIRTMVSALSALFRLSLNRGSDYYTIKQEAEHVSNYVAIQRIRYSGRIRFSVTVDPVAEHCQTLKILLQPLVENAVIHGIEPNGGSGSVEISVIRSGDTIVMTVADDGVGVEEGETLEPKDPDHGYGIHNLRARLALSYGTEQALTIRPRETGGTLAQIEIPAVGVAGETIHEAADRRR